MSRPEADDVLRHGPMNRCALGRVSLQASGPNQSHRGDNGQGACTSEPRTCVAHCPKTLSAQHPSGPTQLRLYGGECGLRKTVHPRDRTSASL